MKKKLVSLLSLILVAVMVFPVGVFADGAVTLYFNATTEKGKKTYQIDASAFTGDDAIVKWTSTDESVVTVSDKGLVTAVGEGSAYISGYDAKNDQKINQEFKSISRTLKSIAVDTTSKFEKKYYTGDVFDPTGMVIKATYDNGDVDSISTGYTYTPSGALNTSISEIEIAYKDGNSEKKCKQAIEVTELYVTKVQIINYAKEYVEGDTIKDVRIKVTYNDETTEEKESGFTISNTAALKTTDTSFTATYRGVTSDSVTITVKEKPSETEKPSTGSVISYTIEMTTAPTKKTYKVGDLFDDSGMKVKVYQIKTPVGGGNSMKTDYSSEVSGLTYTTYKIKDTDAGKDYIEFEISFNADGKTETATLKVTGLTIGNAVDESRIAEITAVALKEDKYPEGYKF